MDISVNVGDKLLRIMKEKGFEQKQDFSTFIELNNAVVSKLLNNERPMNMTHLIKITTAFPDIDPRWILGVTDEMYFPNWKNNGKTFIESEIIDDVNDRMKNATNDMSALKLKIIQLETKLEMLSAFNEKLISKLGGK